MPTGEIHRRLAATILALSRDYSTPAFEPHVTLLGGIAGPARQAVTKSAELAKLLRPFRARLTGVETFEEYFRCVFARVAATRPLMKAHEMARKIFQPYAGSPPRREVRATAYLPHLSLVYGNLAANVKTEILARLGTRWELEFRVRGLSLFAIQGGPEAWLRVAAFALR